jgi:hypothetical protein
MEGSLVIFKLCFLRFLLIITLSHLLPLPAQAHPRSSFADSVKAEFLHAWNAYKKYAWGHDALKPLSKQPHDWYGTSLLMAPVDAAV